MADSENIDTAGAVRLVGLWTFCSRILGLLRDAGMAALFGNGVILDAFTVAFRIPNLARALFGEGALTAAFLPRFVQARESSPETGWRLLSNTLVSLTALLCGLVLAAELFLGTMAWFVPTDAELQRLLLLTAIMLPYCVLVCVTALLCAALNGLQRFGWPAVIPIALNAAWLAGLVVLTIAIDDDDRRIVGIAALIVAAGLLQLTIAVMVLARIGFRLRPDWRTLADDWRGVWQAMLPVVAGLAVTQVNAMLDSVLAWGLSAPEAGASGAAAEWWQPLSAGSASALYLAQRLYQFPIGVFGVALATILFPRFTRHALARRWDLYRQDVQLGIGATIAVGVPAGAGLYCIAEPLAAACFQYGAFDARDVRQTANAIAAYGIGVAAYCSLIVIHRAFYAVDDRLTPVRIGVRTVLLNLVLNLVFVWSLKESGLALATALAACVQAVAACVILARRIEDWTWAPLITATWKTCLATSVMVGACLAIGTPFEATTMTARLLNVVAITCTGGATFAAIAFVLRLEEVFWLLRRNRSTPN